MSRNDRVGTASVRLRFEPTVAPHVAEQRFQSRFHFFGVPRTIHTGHQLLNVPQHGASRQFTFHVPRPRRAFLSRRSAGRGVGLRRWLPGRFGSCCTTAGRRQTERRSLPAILRSARPDGTPLGHSGDWRNGDCTPEGVQRTGGGASIIPVEVEVPPFIAHWINEKPRRTFQARPVPTPTQFSACATRRLREARFRERLRRAQGSRQGRPSAPTRSGVPYQGALPSGASARRLRNQESRSSRVTSLSQPANISDPRSSRPFHGETTPVPFSRLPSLPAPTSFATCSTCRPQADPSDRSGQARSSVLLGLPCPLKHKPAS